MMSHNSLDAVIASYMQAVEAGHVPDRQELQHDHPDIAEQVRQGCHGPRASVRGQDNCCDTGDS